MPPRPSAPKVYTPVACTNLLVARYPREASSVPPVTCWRHYRTGRIGVAARSSCLGGVHVGLLLCLGDVLLVPDSFVTKPIVNLELDKIVRLNILNVLYYGNPEDQEVDQYQNKPAKP